MLENLQNLVREHAGDAIINNPAIPNERNEEVVADASSSIVSGLKTAAANGNINALTDLFKGGATNSPVRQDIESGFANNLVQKLGLDKGKAGQIAAALIPVVLQKFVNKTNDPNDKSFDLPGVLGSLTGGGGMGDMLKKFGGGDDNKEGGMLDKLKGMF